MNRTLSSLFPCRCRAIIATAAATTAATIGAGQALPATAIPLDTFTVVGSKADVELIPGSATFVEVSEIRNQGYDDINQIVRRLPGVYVRQEDGYGLFPNISFRGVSTTRNSKITVMEDGILSAPAPYSAPAAYYTPATGRMHAVEVLMGSSQIKYGPHTTGGVLNYLSTPVPDANGGYASVSVGSDRDHRVHAYYGGRLDTAWASVGFLAENAYRRTRGFKTIDATAAYPGSTATGFERNEPMVKLRLDLKTAVPQSLEFKWGRTDLDADETYLGLTEADFRANPYRRYAATRFDNITTEQDRLYLRYAIEPLEGLRLGATVYYNAFARSWYKLDSARVANGSFVNLSQALAGQFGQPIIDVLKGSAAGDLRVRDNNRTYYARGAELTARYDFATGAIGHLLESSLRWHRDSETRFQRDDVYTQDSAGAITGVSRGAPGSQDNRTGEAEAVAFYLQDRLTVGRLHLTPGVRYERIQYTDTRRVTTPGPTFNEVLPGFPRSTTVDYWAPGLGITWPAAETVTVFAGAYRGVSVPGPGDAVGANQLREEKSIGLEVGTRYRHSTGVSVDAIFFHTGFDDLIVIDNIGGGGGAGTRNVGKVNSRGLELALRYDAGLVHGWALRNPWNLNFTYTRATLANDVNAASASGGAVESIFAGGRKGSRVPYIPEYQVAVGTGLEGQRWAAYVDAFYVPRTFGTANNTGNLRAGANADQAFDSRFGRTDRHLLVDVAVHYRATANLRLKATVENLLDWKYVASRVPIGPRPGPPRLWSLGAEYTF